MEYTTASILAVLDQEKEENSYVSKKLLDETIAWIAIFESYPPDVVFDLGGDPYFFIPFLDGNKTKIEEIVLGALTAVVNPSMDEKPKRKPGPSKKLPEEIRKHHIGVYLTDAEFADLANRAGTRIPQEKPGERSGGDTAARRKIAAYLRAAAFCTLPLRISESIGDTLESKPAVAPSATQDL